MICTRLLPILGALLFGSHGTPLFESDVTLRGMVLDDRGHVYIGAVNVLYQLDPQLRLLNKTYTGPVQDHPDCAPPQLDVLTGGKPYCFETGISRVTTDNYNQLILIDDVSGYLITCGNVYQGTCEARMLSDLTYTIPESESFMPDSFVVSTNNKLKSVGFVATTSDNRQSLYVGSYLSPTGDFLPEQDKRPAIANRNLVVPDSSFDFYVNNKISLYVERSWHKKEFVEVTFVSGFSSEQFAYFLFHEKSRNQDGATESRIARICLSDKGNTNSPIADSTYTSYIELPLQCTYEGKVYPALSSVRLETVLEFYVDDKVLVGMFGDQDNKTAICSFSFDEINRRLNDKVRSCSSGQGDKKLRSEAAQVPCKTSRTKCEDVCSCTVRERNYPLEVDSTYSVAGSLSLNGDVVTLATNVVGRSVEIFVGVSESDMYSVMKIVLESPDRAHFISDYTSESSQTKILQLEVLKSKEEILILTESSLYTMPISVCAAYLNAGCSKCLMVKDPHCGWCEMTGKCTTEDMCTTDLWRTDGDCTAITDIEPRKQSMLSQSTSNKITIITNNKYPAGTSLVCDYGKYGQKTAQVADNGNITCKIPYLVPVVAGKHVIDVTLLSGSVRLATSESAFTFFNCDSYTTCTSCTEAAVGCGWCVYANSCSQICHKTTQTEQCPALTYTKSYIPVNFQNQVQISGVNLPKPLSDDVKTYECQIELEGSIVTLPAQHINSSTVLCTANYTFRTSPTSGESLADVKLLWRGGEIEAARSPELSIYRCNVLGGDCSSCRAHSTLKRCGWCESRKECLQQLGGYEICSTSYSEVCAGLEIYSFEPKHGPLEGGTIVKIKGINLGSKPSDVTSIKIAGRPCEVLTEGFEVSKVVMCRTGQTDSMKHGLVEVTTAGDRYIHNSMFYYKNYRVGEIKPKCGIAAGGTIMSIYGEDLNIGTDMSIIVAGALCEVTGKPASKQVTCQTKPGVIGSHKVQVNIDSGKQYSPAYYQVVENPSPMPLPTNSSIASGGITIRVTFDPEYKLDCVQKLGLVFPTLTRQHRYGECIRSGPDTFACITPTVDGVSEGVLNIQAHLKADNHILHLDPFTIYPDPVVQPINSTNEEGYIEWPISETRELVLNGYNLSNVHGISVYVDDFRVGSIKVTNDHIVLTPPKFSDLQQFRKKRRAGERRKRDVGDKKYEGSDYVAIVTVKLGRWEHQAGRLYYTKSPSSGIPYVAIIIPIAGFIVLVLLLTYVGMKYHSSKQSHRRTLKTVRLHMEKLEMRVANECKDAFTALQTHLTDLHGSVADVPFRHFSDFMASVLFPGTEVETKDLLARLSAPPSKVVETPQLAQFRRLLMDREFLQRFVEIVEADPHFDVAHKCKMASLLVITLSTDMKYLTEVLFTLMEKLIDKFLAKKNHPQLLLRRTESVADKLLTHWLNYCCFEYLTRHAGKSIFTLFSAIKQQLDLGPQDEITFEAKSSLNNEKMLRETIDFKLLNGTVRDLDKNEHLVSLLTCDSIKQAKRKVLEAVHRNKPASHIPPLESFDLMYIRSNTPVILREIDKAPVVEGWRKLNTLSDYKIEEPDPMFAMVPLSTDSEHSSISPQAERRKASFLTSKRYRSKGNLINAGVHSDHEREEPHQLYHLVKPSIDNSETDTLLSTKMMSEVFLTRLLSTKGTLQPYVDDLFSSVFMPRDKVPFCIKYLFDFLERQAHRHNLAHNQHYIHTWKNNSLSLRFWMNILKNPYFLLDINQTPTIDSSLNIICGVFMDSCSTSDKGLTKDSPINKLLYAKDIPKYKKLVQIHYEQVTKLPTPTIDFLNNLPPTGLNSTVAVSELLKIAQKYQKQLQTSFLANSPSLNLKFASIVDSSILTHPNMI